MAKQRSERAKPWCGTRLESKTRGGLSGRDDTDEATEKCVRGIGRVGGGRGVTGQNEAIGRAGGKQAVQYEAGIPGGEDNFSGAGMCRRATLDLGNVTRPKCGKHAFAADFGVNGQRRAGAEIGAAAQDIRDQR